MLGVSGIASFCQVRQGGGHCGKKGKKGSLRRGTRLFIDQPICSGTPPPIPCKRLETGTLSPRFWLPLEIERPLGRLRASTPSPAAAPHSQSCQTHRFQVSTPPPPHRRFSSQDGGSGTEAPVSSPSLVSPPPHPPCRGSQENDLSCWGGGWGRSWSLSSARTLTHTHTLRQTAAAQAAPPPLLPHCGDTCPPACSALAAKATPTASLAKGKCPCLV